MSVACSTDGQLPVKEMASGFHSKLEELIPSGDQTDVIIALFEAVVEILEWV